MDVNMLSKIVGSIAKEYHIKKVILFGSRANNTNRDDSDVDLIIEFSEPVSLLTLSKIKLHLEELLHLNVDIVHGPLQKDDFLKIDKEVELYVA